MKGNRSLMQRSGFLILLGILTIACGAPTHDEFSTVKKLQNTIKAMEALLKKQQQKMMAGFEGMRRRVNTLEKIADKTRREMEKSRNIVCPPLSAPSNGRILGGRRRSVGDFAYYVCGPGYEMIGTEERACLDNATWSGRRPECKKFSDDKTDSTPWMPECSNRPGTTKVCSCPIGFQLSMDQSVCTDVDECGNVTVGTKTILGASCQYKCKNAPGSYRCVCPPGYAQEATIGCRDEDECATGDHDCSSAQMCINTYGGYKCASVECPRQYIKTGERLCEKIPCAPGDEECRALKIPYSITYHFMAITPNIRVPATIYRLTTNNRINGSITRFSVVPGKDSFYFTSRRVDKKTGWLVVYQQPTGPKTLEVEFQAKEHQRSGHLLATHLSKVVIYVSEYSF